MAKLFKDDFFKLLNILKSGEPFAFSRFSDGELDILKNIRLLLGPGIVQVGKRISRKNYKPVDHKDFDPVIPEHQLFRTRLIEAYMFRKENYFKGLSCRCCVGRANFKWMLDLHGPGDDEHLTWANLLVNSNYPLFAKHMLPEFSNHDCVMICHKKANLSKLPFKLKKDFRVGYNAMINDYDKINEIIGYIDENNIKNHVFLFSASSFSALAIHKLFEFSNLNTYINIGTTLNPFIGMPVDRIYLKGY